MAKGAVSMGYEGAGGSPTLLCYSVSCVADLLTFTKAISSNYGLKKTMENGFIFWAAFSAVS